MASSLKGLLYDATLLRKFVKFVCDYCEEQESSLTYADQSKVFFTYIADLGRVTLQFLDVFVLRASSVVRSEIYRQKLHLLKNCWALLHYYAKPAADGHSLATPGPLIRFFEREIGKLLPNSKVIILITPELNYFQHPLKVLKRLTSDLKILIKEAPPFEEGVGFISIPYSQGLNVFMNSLIGHELGHFAFEELGKQDDLSDEIHKILNQKFGKKIDPDVRQWLHDRLNPWVQEIFCDLFALRLLGPAYSFAYLEFLLLGRIDKSAALVFYPSHPADASRLREHLREMKRQNWWTEVASSRSEHIKLIQIFASLPSKRYSYKEDGLDLATQTKIGKMLIPTFLRMLPPVRKVVRETIDANVQELKNYRRWNNAIRKHLKLGVVPSTLSIRNKFHHPTPVALINAAMGFYIEALDELVENVTGRSPRNLRDRSELSQRLEMWTMKALEDHQLLFT